MDEYSLAFAVSNIGPKGYQKILRTFGSAEQGWSGEKAQYYELGIKDKTYQKFDAFRKVFDTKKYLQTLEKEKVIFVSFLDKNYPQGLKKIENPPIGLFCKGNMGLLNTEFLIGVVGTRKVTEYGRDVTQLLVGDLVSNGACIVSGLALGVDGLAHRTTLQSNGHAIAVLACGVDCCLPSENFNLYNDILRQNGLIVSEYPLSQSPNKGTFLARNRIVAALSNGVLITEAASGSGSLVTAGYALLYGKKVFAVPGQITSRMSDGTKELLKKGAKIVFDTQDILSELRIMNHELGKDGKIKNQKFKNLTREERSIVSLLQNEALIIDEISRKTKLPVSKLFISLSNLELKKIVKNMEGKITLTQQEGEPY